METNPLRRHRHGPPAAGVVTGHCRCAAQPVAVEGTGRRRQQGLQGPVSWVATGPPQRQSRGACPAWVETGHRRRQAGQQHGRLRRRAVEGRGRRPSRGDHHARLAAASPATPRGCCRVCPAWGVTGRPPCPGLAAPPSQSRRRDHHLHPGRRHRRRTRWPPPARPRRRPAGRQRVSSRAAPPAAGASSRPHRRPACARRPRQPRGPPCVASSSPPQRLPLRPQRSRRRGSASGTLPLPQPSCASRRAQCSSCRH